MTNGINTMWYDAWAVGLVLAHEEQEGIKHLLMA